MSKRTKRRRTTRRGRNGNTPKSNKRKASKANTKTKQPTRAETRERNLYRLKLWGEVLRLLNAYLPEIKAAAPYVWEHLEQGLTLLWQMWGNG